MTELERLKQELSVYQAEMLNINKQKKKLSDKIYDICSKIDKIDSLKPVYIKPTNKLLERDMILCKSFLKTGHKTSREIIDFLNTKLNDQSLRWKNTLDGNIFMTVVGNHLKEFAVNEKIVSNGRQMMIWKLK